MEWKCWSKVSLASLFKIFIEKVAILHTFKVIIDGSFDRYYCSHVDMIIGLVCQNSKFIYDIQILELTLDRINNISNDFKGFIKLLLSKCNSISTLHLNIDDINKYSQIVYHQEYYNWI